MSLISTALYVQVRVDRMIVRNVDAQITVDRSSLKPFSHPRTLVGDFVVADAFLKALLAEARKGFSISTEVLIHPMERVEGGLSQVEERVFHELARGAGASRVLVYCGAPLSDADVRSRLASSK